MQMLKDAKGQTSSMRAMAFMVVFLIMLGWVIVSGLQHHLVEIPNSLLGLIGMALSGKTIQKWVEENADKAGVVQKIVAAVEKSKTDAPKIS